jgi:surfeit locus 1 family protein
MLRINNTYFSPALIPSIAALIVFVVLVLLGFWQLDRAEEKRVIEDEVHKAQVQQALNLNVYLKDQMPVSLLAKIYHSAEVEGHYDNEHQFLYDNRTYKGKSGYHVLTPLRLSDSKVAVLINRGWIPYNGLRDNIPSIQVTNEKQIFLGEIRNPSQSIVLSDVPQTVMKFPVTIQNISVAALSKQLGYPLLPIVIELDKAQSLGFVREWQPYYGKIDKHIAYAIQWFLMAAILLFLYVKLNTKRILSNE